MNPPLERKTQVFVMRVWREYMQNDEKNLRGEIEDLTNKEKYVFSNFHDLQALVWACCNSENEHQNVITVPKNQ